MIPKPPPRDGGLGFLFIPPFRVQGVSVAGEATSIFVPELDVCFDMGECPRSALPAKFVAISHGHMDHVGGLAYFCSQRHFQGMGEANIICHEGMAPAIRKMMDGYVDLEQQVTPYNLIPMAPVLKADRSLILKSTCWATSRPSSIRWAIARKTRMTT